jgi:hypothetical protein
VFGESRSTPASPAGRRLLGHELIHVIQQLSNVGAVSPVSALQRTPDGGPTISIVDENLIGPLSLTERRAAKSCTTTCLGHSLGTLHIMPLFYHASLTTERGDQVKAGSSSATGIGAAMHFIASGTQPKGGEQCHCEDFHIIQVVGATGEEGHVDNGGESTPFYEELGQSGRGVHAIYPGYPDAGEQLESTESIYDRPYRTVNQLRRLAKSQAEEKLPFAGFSFMAESCVACMKSKNSGLLLGGCVTYGFTRAYDATARSFGSVVAVDPRCLAVPSQSFTSTLSGDPTTSDYKFERAPQVEVTKPTKD